MSHHPRENTSKQKKVGTQTSFQASKMVRRAFIMSLGIAVVAPLVGCGRKSAPDKPKDSKYPRDYPSP